MEKTDLNPSGFTRLYMKKTSNENSTPKWASPKFSDKKWEHHLTEYITE